MSESRRMCDTRCTCTCVANVMKTVANVKITPCISEHRIISRYPGIGFHWGLPVYVLCVLCVCVLCVLCVCCVCCMCYVCAVKRPSVSLSGEIGNRHRNRLGGTTVTSSHVLCVMSEDNRNFSNFESCVFVVLCLLYVLCVF